MSGIIPKDQLAAYQRWQFNDFDAPATAEPAPPVVETTYEEPEIAAVEEIPAGEMPLLPTAEEIAQMHDEARQAGYEAGFEAGRLAGEEAAREAFQASAQHIASLLDNLESALAELDQQVADQILEVALEVARQLGRGSIQADKHYLQPIIREALTMLPLHHNRVNIVVNPEDAGALREHMGEFLAQHGTQIIEDASIDPGGCKVRADASEIDATTDTRWRRILEAIGTKPEAWLKTP